MRCQAYIGSKILRLVASDDDQGLQKKVHSRGSYTNDAKNTFASVM